MQIPHAFVEGLRDWLNACGASVVLGTTFLFYEGQQTITNLLTVSQLYDSRVIIAHMFHTRMMFSVAQQLQS